MAWTESEKDTFEQQRGFINEARHQIRLALIEATVVRHSRRDVDALGQILSCIDTYLALLADRILAADE